MRQQDAQVQVAPGLPDQNIDIPATIIRSSDESGERKRESDSRQPGGDEDGDEPHSK